jgi:transcriptional regulator with XRE-family HTH domain
MDNRSEVREFLSSRRAKITPEQAGLPAFGSRRVAGLRRGEVAALAGVSVEYYTRLERGNLAGVSDSVLDALARALQLDENERTHLYDLARAANSSPAARARRRPTASEVRPSVQRIIAAMGTPAFVRNNRFDILDANPLGRALYSDMYLDPAQPVNTARFIFLDPRAPRFYVDWENTARQAAGALRIQAGQNPYDRQLSNLIGELTTRSEVFRTWWAAHDVHVHRHGVKRLQHPLVGRLDLSYEAMELPGDTGLTIVTYNAEPGTPAADALTLLASWAATEQQTTSPASRGTDTQR